MQGNESQEFKVKPAYNGNTRDGIVFRWRKVPSNTGTAELHFSERWLSGSASPFG